MSEELKGGAPSDVVDLEEYSKTNRTPPKAKRYRIRVDKEHYEVEAPGLTGREILMLAGKQPPERFRLDQKMRGGETRKIELDQYIDFTAPGIERFMTLPLDQTEGGADEA